MLPSKKRIPNLFKKKQTMLPPIQKPVLLTPTSLRTTSPTTMPVIKCRTTKELIRETLKRIDWKTSYGIAVHVGVTGQIPHINEIAGWLNERFRYPLTIVDDCIRKDSILKSVAGNVYRTPPSIKGDVRLRTDAQELLDSNGNPLVPVFFLSVPDGAGDGVESIAKAIGPETMIFGTPDACADVLEAAELSAQPIFYCGGMLAVRAA